ncbi:hypothetical protein [uncultured Thiodictyon sp.]|uniref:hypothetical protein n=1 Tax=uncultured Thiodictyon sp. TaxID=1846217 RepID=UPI0025EE9929|nr:hypothetical protein [uncultured Thiodictyon sp.]
MASQFRPTSLQALRIAEHVYLRHVEHAAELPADLPGFVSPSWLIYAAFTRGGALLLKQPSGQPLMFPTQAAAIATVHDVRPDVEPDVRGDLSFLLSPR